MGHYHQLDLYITKIPSQKYYLEVSFLAVTFCHRFLQSTCAPSLPANKNAPLNFLSYKIGIDKLFGTSYE